MRLEPTAYGVATISVARCLSVRPKSAHFSGIEEERENMVPKLS